MGYWAASEFAGRLPQAVLGQEVITGSSNPIDLTQAQQILDEHSAEFDSAAAHAGYLTPISSAASQAWNLARLVVYNGARAHVMQTINVGRDASLSGEYRAAYLRAIEDIMRGNLPLVGAPNDTGESGRSLPRSSGIGSPMISASWMP